MADDDGKRLLFDEHSDREPACHRSPVNLALRIKIPVLLVHDGSDKNTQLEQAERMRQALIASGKVTE